MNVWPRVFGGLALGRSANASNANNARNVTATGSNNNNNANNANYYAPDSSFAVYLPDVSNQKEGESPCVTAILKGTAIPAKAKRKPRLI